MIRSLSDNWIDSFRIERSAAAITEDSRRLIALIGKDSLLVLDLKNKTKDIDTQMLSVLSYPQTARASGLGIWKSSVVNIKNFKTGQIRMYKGVRDFILDSNEAFLILISYSSVSYVSLQTFNEKDYCQRDHTRAILHSMSTTISWYL